MEVSKDALRLLFAAGSGDAALLYLWQCAEDETMPCPLGEQKKQQAQEVLTRLGLARQEEKPLRRDERPTYTEDAVSTGLRKKDFSALVGEAQRLLGRVLSTEELKCLLSIHDYLRLPKEVTALLISYCVQRAKNRGVRAPGMRTIEKEAYYWSDLGIDNVEAAVQYMQGALVRQSRRGIIARLLQITARRLTAAEEEYIDQWIAWGFPDDAIRMAYEKTCLNTGGLKWPYLHSILKSWNEKGLHTVQEIRDGDGAKPASAPNKRQVTDVERDAVRRLMERKEG